MAKLGKVSIENLRGVNPQLIKLVETAILNTPIDFRVTDGLRTLEEQKYLVSIGASKTMNSKHLTGQAIDIVPWVKGNPRWEWPLIFTIAEHIRSVAKELNVRLIWGALWDTPFTASVSKLEDLVDAYTARCKQRGKKVFLDGPHYELVDRTIK